MKPKPLFVTLFLLSILPILANAQYYETIRTDRPGQAIGPYSVGKNVYQLQPGVDYSGLTDPATQHSKSSIAPSTFIRAGLTKRFELNSNWGYRKDFINDSSRHYSTNGLSASSIGSRFNITEGNTLLPAIGLQVTFKLPVLTTTYNHSFVAPKILLTASQNLSNKIALLVNTGIDYNGNTAEPSGIYVLNLGYSISHKFATFIENYGSFSNGVFENHWDTGLAYLVNNNLQLDLYGGLGNNAKKTTHFLSVGASWRISTLENE